ncbi:putative phytosulfokines 6 [Mercurialis annua]|uniref:putative phytosulfokines 6 n=1 Tax=Mercurialis annua TaxID=3986 RepID=UPI002160C527|nr:putative phytosulfokines 6 [Mercurialis annua]
MKQSFYYTVFFFLFLLYSSKLSAALIPNTDIASEDSLEGSGLMGSEACESGDEECLKRRMTSEAHLDYIYTQQHEN